MQKMYKYELHCHENVVSRCGKWSPKELVENYAKNGYTGVVITNHFFNGSCNIDGNIPWKEMVEDYCKGYEIAKEEGAKVGLDIFFAFEYSVDTFYGEDLSEMTEEKVRRISGKNTLGGCDFLIYGLGKEWLLSQSKDLLKLPVNDFLKYVKESGGTVIHAHPFRLTEYMDHISLFPKFTDGIEILNGNPNTIGVPNNMAKYYAKEYGFFATAGTDSHTITKFFAVTKLKQKASSIFDIIDQLKNGKAKLELVKNKLYKE